MDISVAVISNFIVACFVIPVVGSDGCSQQGIVGLNVWDSIINHSHSIPNSQIDVTRLD